MTLTRTNLPLRVLVVLAVSGALTLLKLHYGNKLGAALWTCLGMSAALSLSLQLEKADPSVVFPARRARRYASMFLLVVASTLIGAQITHDLHDKAARHAPHETKTPAAVRTGRAP